MGTTNIFCTNCGSGLGTGDQFCPSCGQRVPFVELPTTATEPLTVGGRFRLEGVLGRGAAGTVYLAVEEPLGGRVALKSLDPALASMPSFRGRFRAEAATLAGLSHPNVVGVRDYVEDDAGAYLVMDRVEGPSLRQLLSSYGHLVSEQACGVLSGALTGLAFAHESNLLHGDIKPENVLVDMAGVSMLTDFGQAVPLGSLSSGGSAPYLSPEAIEGRPLDQRSDLYSMGVVLFECLAGRTPFVAGQIPTLFHQALNQPAPTITGLPGPMAGLLARSLAKDPDGRPGSAREFLAELDEAARHAYGADWATRAGVAALAGAVGVGAVMATEAGAAPSGAGVLHGSGTPAGSGGTTGTGPGGTGGAGTPTPVTPAGQVAPGSGTAVTRTPHWLSKTLVGHKVVATVVAAVLVAGAVAGVVVATRSSSTGRNASATERAAGAGASGGDLRAGFQGAGSGRAGGHSGVGGDGSSTGRTGPASRADRGSRPATTPPPTIRATTTTVPTPPSFAAVVGSWTNHNGGITINASGDGTWMFQDFTNCPSCTTADAPGDTVLFHLTSIQNGAATGSITSVSGPNGESLSDGMSIQITVMTAPPGFQPVSGGPGEMLNIVADGRSNLVAAYCDAPAEAGGDCGA